MKFPIVHFEIPADDVERARTFYKETFGWETHKFDMPANSSTGGDPYYGVMTTEMNEQHRPKTPGEINGGLMKRKNPGQVFMNYIQAEDIDAILPIIKENGGEICMPKTEVAPGRGWIACFKDTEGNMMGLHQQPDQLKKS